MPATDYLASVLFLVSPGISIYLITDKIMNDNPLNLGIVSITNSIGIGAERFFGLRIDEKGFHFGIRGGGKKTKGITSGFSVSWKPADY